MGAHRRRAAVRGGAERVRPPARRRLTGHEGASASESWTQRLASRPAGAQRRPLVTERQIPPSADVVIIGAGHNGLVSAILLARAGLSVVVLEAGEVIGGATRTERPFPKVPE